MPGDVGRDLGRRGMADRRLVEEVAVAQRAVLGQAAMRHPGGAEPALRLGALPGQLVRAHVLGVGEFLDGQQLAPLLPADDGEAVAVVRHVRIAERLEGEQHLGAGHAVVVGLANIRADRLVGGGIERRDDQLVGLAAEGIGAGIRHHRALVDVGLELVHPVDPVAGVVVLQEALDIGVVDVHHRHDAVARLGGGGAAADLLEDGGGAAHLGLAAHQRAQLAALALIGLLHFGLVLLDEGLVDGAGHGLPFAWRSVERPCRCGLPRLRDRLGAAPPGESEAELRAMMRDPRYWRTREPAFVTRVTEGFRRLVGQ